MNIDKFNLVNDFYQAHWKYFQWEKLEELLTDVFIYIDNSGSYSRSEFEDLMIDKFFTSANINSTIIHDYSLEKNCNNDIVCTYKVEQYHGSKFMKKKFEDHFTIVDDKIDTVKRF